MIRENDIQWPQSRLSDLQLLIGLALIKFAVHLVFNNQYGFHQDALAFLANGLNLDWGYVAYPPLTPFIGRIGLELFGPSLVGIKSLAVLAQCIAMVVTGLMAKELGGDRRAQVIAALAAAIGIMSLGMSTLFQYITFDYLWWVLIFYCLIRLLKDDNPTWWLGIGIFIGLGMMTKYTMIFLVAGLALSALIFADLRKHLFSRWLWLGVGASLLIFLPNLIWQIQHDFISIDFLNSISARDRAMGRADGFFVQQLYVNLNPVAVPLAIAGLYYLLAGDGQKFRPICIIFILTTASFAVARGRFYYTAPLYPSLLAAGAVFISNWLSHKSETVQNRLIWSGWGLFVVGAIAGMIIFVPFAPVHSAVWDLTLGIHDNYYDQIGWDDLVNETAKIYEAHEDMHQNLGILASHYGSASAFQIYGDSYDLPVAISPVNSYWLRGYGENPPDAVLTIGYEVNEIDGYFSSCDLVGKAENRYGIEKPRPEIFLCSGLLASWETLWPELQRFS